MFNTGHDIGGFDGPVPDAEMLIRWTQACCLVPRMIMNSWKADGSVNSPWLHPEATPTIRAAVALRLKLMPYLYTQLWRAHAEHLPVLRPTFFDFGDDAATWADNDEMMVGPDLLAAPVFEPGARTRRLYLPRHAQGWVDWWSGVHHSGGQWIETAAPLWFPTTESQTQVALYEDDGLQNGGTADRCVVHRFAATARTAKLRLEMDSSSSWPLPYKRIRVVLPADEKRKPELVGAMLVA
jgi:alpha-glucosidase